MAIYHLNGRAGGKTHAAMRWAIDMATTEGANVLYVGLRGIVSLNAPDGPASVEKHLSALDMPYKIKKYVHYRVEFPATGGSITFISDGDLDLARGQTYQAAVADDIDEWKDPEGGWAKLVTIAWRRYLTANHLSTDLVCRLISV